MIEQSIFCKRTHVDEGKYFTSRVHRDIDAIMQDMRETHRGQRGQSDSTPENSAVEELKQDLRKVSVSMIVSSNN